MSYATFKQRWLGRAVDYDGVFGAQCVDLIKQYAVSEYGVLPGAWGNAIDYHTKPASSFTKEFNRISYPRQGDIVVFSGGTYGHIALVDSITASNVASLEQNGSTGTGSGTGGDVIRVRSIPRSRAVAFYRHKSVKLSVTNPVTQGEEMFKTDQEIIEAYAVAGRMPSSGEIASWKGQSKQRFLQLIKAETDAQRKQLADVKKALATEKTKPAIVKEVTKIVEVPVEKITIKEIEVVKEVETNPSWLEAVVTFIRKVLRIKE